MNLIRRYRNNFFKLKKYLSHLRFTVKDFTISSSLEHGFPKHRPEQCLRLPAP